MSELKAVFFDVNGPLWDKAACDRQVMEILLPKLLNSLPEDDPDQVVRRFNAVFLELPDKKLLRGKRSLSHFRRFEALLDSYGLQTRRLARELTHTYDTTRRLTLRQFLRPDAVRVLSELGELGLERGVIMNGPPSLQRHRLETLGLNRHLDHQILAEVEGYFKPDVRLFKRTLALIGAKSEEMLYVGDSPFTDVLGASRAGIPTVWFQTGRRRLPRGFPTPDFTIRDLPELLSIAQM